VIPLPPFIRNATTDHKTLRPLRHNSGGHVINCSKCECGTGEGSSHVQHKVPSRQKETKSGRSRYLLIRNHSTCDSMYTVCVCVCVWVGVCVCVCMYTQTHTHTRAGIAQWYSSELRAGWLGVGVPAGAGNFSLHRVQTGSVVHPASYPMGFKSSFPGDKAAGGMKLTTHLHLVPMSRMHGVVPTLPRYIFMAWCSVKTQG
jgi:hypothetical protein